MLMVCSAKALDSFAVDYIEITNPSSSEQALEDSKAIAALGLKVGDTIDQGNKQRYRHVANSFNRPRSMPVRDVPRNDRFKH